MMGTGVWLALALVSQAQAQAPHSALPLEPATQYDADPWYRRGYWQAQRNLTEARAAAGREHQDVNDGAARLWREGIVTEHGTLLPSAQGVKDQFVANRNRAHGLTREVVTGAPARLRTGAGLAAHGAANGAAAAGTAAGEGAQTALPFWEAGAQAPRQAVDAWGLNTQTTVEGQQRRVHRLEVRMDALATQRARTLQKAQQVFARAPAVLTGSAQMHGKIHGVGMAGVRMLAPQVVEGPSRALATLPRALRDVSRQGQQNLTDANHWSVNRLAEAWARGRARRQALGDWWRGARHDSRTSRAEDLDNWNRAIGTSLRHHAQALNSDAHHTVSSTRASVETDAATLWYRGVDRGLYDGLALAGDNRFAGDAEGAVLAAYYSTAAVGQAAGTVAVLEPMAAVGNLAPGVLGLAAVVGRGAVGLVALQVRLWGSLAGLAISAAVGQAVLASTALARLALTAGWTALEVGLPVGALMLGGVGIAGLSAARAGLTALLTLALAGALAVLPAAGLVALVAGAMPAAHAGLGAVTGVALVGVALWGVGLGAAAWGAHGARAASSVAWMGLASAGSAAAWLGLSAVTGAWMAATLGGAVVAPAGILLVLSVLRPPLVFARGAAQGLFSGVRMAAGHPMAAGVAWVSTLAAVTGQSALLGGAWLTVAAGGNAWVAAKSAVRVVGTATAVAFTGTAKLADEATAPLRFERQLAWRAERLPQVQEMLNRQSPTVRAQVGDRVEYVRVVAGGIHRGKVAFFDTRADGRRHRFYRLVTPSCEVTYVSGTTTVHSGQADAACLEDTP